MSGREMSDYAVINALLSLKLIKMVRNLSQNIYIKLTTISLKSQLLYLAYQNKAGYYIISHLMQFNPLEGDETNTAKQSKAKGMINTVPTPLTFHQVEKMIDEKQIQPGQSKLSLLGRVVRLKDMVGRTIVTLSDQTGVVNVIETQYADLMEENAYFQFIVSVRLDKDQPVLISLHAERITDFNRLLYNMACIMSSQCRP